MPSNREIILDSRPNLGIVGHINDAVELAIFATIFSALKKSLEGPARFFLLPAALTGDFIRFVISVADFFNANNRNLNKTSKVLLEIAKLGMVATAIIGSLIGVVAIAAITPFLFIGAMGLNAIYHTAKAVFHGYKWASSKGEFGKKHHKKEFYNNLVFALTGFVAVAAITLLLVLKPEIGIFQTLASIGTAVALGTSALWSGVQAYLSFKNRKAIPQYEKKAEADDAKKEAVLSPKPAPTKTVASAPALNAKKNRFRAPNLRQHHDDLIEEVLFHARPAGAIKHLLNTKIETLIQQNKKEFFLFEKNKRQDKIDFLTHLHTLMSGEEASVMDRGSLVLVSSPDELLAIMKKNNVLKSVFSSFFSEVGEVQKMFLLTETYFEKCKPNVQRHPEGAVLIRRASDDALTDDYRPTAYANGIPSM